MSNKQKQPPTPLTPEEEEEARIARLQALLEKTGNNLHMRVVKQLQDAGWHVDLSAYYCDDTTTKPREIDTVASKEFSIKLQDNYAPTRFIRRLYIECKYFKEEVAFRMMPVKPDNIEQAIKSTGFTSGHDLALKEPLRRHHHYRRVDEVAKLWDTEDGSMFDAVTQPVKAYAFLHNLSRGNCLHYPVTVYGGIKGIHQLENDNFDLKTAKKKTRSVFEIYYSYRNQFPSTVNMRTEFFFIDFLHESEFGKFLDELEKETETAQEERMNAWTWKVN